VDRVNRAKVAIALADDVEMPWRDADALSTWLLDRFHAQRLGARSTPAEDVAGAIERIVRKSRRGRMTSRRAAAVRVGAIWLSGVDERTLGDIARVVRRGLGHDLPEVIGGARLDVDTASSDGEVITAVEESLLSWGGDDRLTLCPDGIVGERLGSSFEAHGLAVVSGARLSMAVRWHGSNAAVLWDIETNDGHFARRPELRCGADDQWSSRELRGEGLWRVTSTAPVLDGSESVSFG